MRRWLGASGLALAVAGTIAWPPAATAGPGAEDCQGVAGLGALDEPTRWRGVVDRLEGELAIVEVGIGRFIDVARCRLPRRVREGDVVALGPGPPRFWAGTRSVRRGGGQ